MATEIVHHSEDPETYPQEVGKRGDKSLDRPINEKVIQMLNDYVNSVGSQVEAARQMGFSQGYLSELLKGGRGGGAKLIKGLAKVGRVDILLALLAPTSAPPVITTTGYERYPHRSAAIALMVENGEGTFEEIQAAADAVGSALYSESDLPRLEWVEDIRAELRRKRRGEPHPGVLVTVEESAKEQAATVRRFTDGVKNGGKKKP